MAKRPLPAVEEDFGSVVAFLKTRGVIPASPRGEMIAGAKRLHRATYSLILWKFRLQRLPEHGQVFIEEIASDALQILPQALMGYGKTTKLLIRGVIENALRHIYFLDHPIEFARMNREHKWYVDVTELLGYPPMHPALIGMEAKFDAVNRLRTLYNDLSAGVHGRRVQDLEMRAALTKIGFSQLAFIQQVADAEKCAESVNFLLALVHGKQMSDWQREDRQVFLHTMPPRARQIWQNAGQA